MKKIAIIDYSLTNIDPEEGTEYDERYKSYILYNDDQDIGDIVDDLYSDCYGINWYSIEDIIDASDAKSGIEITHNFAD